MAGNRLIEVTFPFTVGFLDGAITAAFLVVASKNTILVAYDGSYQITILIGINNSLLLDDRLCFRRKFVPDNRKNLFQFGNFVFLDGSAGVAFIIILLKLKVEN